MGLTAYATLCNTKDTGQTKGNTMKPVIVKANTNNKDWKYMAVCEQHGYVLEAQTKKELLNSNTKQFCAECYGS